MKKVSLRAFSAILMAFLIIIGLGVYVGRYIKDGEMWALYFDQSTSGSEYTLTDRNGTLLAKMGGGEKSYAENAKRAGLDGVVCSPLEASLVHEKCGADFLCVTPGIRFAGGDIGDQSRVTTPAKAREIGSDYIVVGRPITAADDPVAAYERCVRDFTGVN